MSDIPAHHGNLRVPSVLVETTEIELSTALVTSFWLNVSRGQAPDDCWSWSSNRTADDYAKLYDPKSQKTHRAHRVSWTIHNGLIPPGLIVCHSCDNPPCTNPAHLFLGDLLENNADAIAKGRMFSRKHVIVAIPPDEARERIAAVMAVERKARLERMLTGPKPGTKHASKLTPDQARQIFALLEAGESQSEIARQFGIKGNSVWRMDHGLGWRDVAKHCGFIASARARSKAWKSKLQKSKITTDQAREIFSLLAAGKGQAEIARQFGVGKTAIWKMSKGLTRADVAVECGFKGPMRARRLTLDRARQVFVMLSAGAAHAEIVKQVGVGGGTVSRMANGLAWTELAKEYGFSKLRLGRKAK